MISQLTKENLPGANPSAFSRSYGRDSSIRLISCVSNNLFTAISQQLFKDTLWFFVWRYTFDEQTKNWRVKFSPSCLICQGLFALSPLTKVLAISSWPESRACQRGQFPSESVMSLLTPLSHKAYTTWGRWRLIACWITVWPSADLKVKTKNGLV